MFWTALSSLGLLIISSGCLAQELFPPAASRTNTFNASYGPLNPQQALEIIKSANLSKAQAEAVLVAVNFERSNWAGSSTQLDPFYSVADSYANASYLQPGIPIKVEQRTNVSLYTLPPGVALSRFVYTTKTLNGSVIPASAYVLWPFQRRRFRGVDGIPTVGWAHGTSGWSGECAPSHIRNLWYQYSTPFTLALQGYAVVAPDYAGLGVDHDAAGNFIAHQYTANPAHGNDLIYAVQAAQKVWPKKLSKDFVLMGHSQGGGAAWGAAEHLARDPVAGYLGTIAASPGASAREIIDLAVGLPILGGGLAKFATGLSSIFPDFQLRDWLTDEGVRTTEALQKLQGCQSVGLEIYSSFNILRGNAWNETYHLDAFDRLTRAGGKEFAGPMLVLQGSADSQAPVIGTSAIVNQTCKALPQSQLQYEVVEGVDHVPVLFAGQQIWLDWIADRFNRVKVPDGCVFASHEAEFEIEAYSAEIGYTLQYALYPYEVA